MVSYKYKFLPRSNFHDVRTLIDISASVQTAPLTIGQVKQDTRVVVFVVLISYLSSIANEGMMQ